MTNSGTALGVLISLLGSFGHSFGLTLQRKAHIQRQQKYSLVNYNTQENSSVQNNNPPPLYKDTLWTLGFVIYLVSSSVCPVFVLIYLPVFVAAPLSAVNLVANTLCAGLVLDFTITWRDYRETIFVTTGAVWMAIFSNIKEKSRSLDDLLKLYKRPVFIVYFSIYELAVISLIIYELYLRSQYRLHREHLSVLRSQNGFIRDSSEESSIELDVEQRKSSIKNSESDLENPLFYIGTEPDKTHFNSANSPKYERLNNEVDLGEVESRLAQSLSRKNNKSNESYNGYISSSSKSVTNNAENSYLNSTISENTPLLENGGFPISPNYKESGQTKVILSSEFSEPHKQLGAKSLTKYDKKHEETRQLLKTIKKIENKSGLLSGFISGLICSQSILFTKSSIELVSLTLKGKNQFNNIYSWILLTALISAALGNLYYFNRGLRLTSTIVMIPLAFCSFTVSALTSSLIYYNQFNQLTPFKLSMAGVGLLLIFTGVALLASRQKIETPKLT
ncbi:hypothetical protein BB558_005071 [Smittium angustum]|uniref:Uncharacterized protein n=1 Tax=Smittium angustum TaxID=133377 RepID=A0A2U1J1L9_SMIAN|nr:hypothetical protein BB558_005071 [Smittium angustum]